VANPQGGDAPPAGQENQRKTRDSKRGNAVHATRYSMQFGLFDHIDRSDRPIAQQFDERLELVAAADKAGFYSLHVAEHHATPLNMIPVPGVYLGAVARVTKRIRMGPMVYLLPLYSPLRLIEEISILDHLSHGRLDVGVGRGVSSFELNFHKVDVENSRAIFADAFACVKEGLTSDRLTYRGEFYQYDNVPIELHPLQRPHPPFWYGSSNETGSVWAGEHGMNFATNGATERARANVATFKAALAKRGGPELRNPAFKEGVAIGASRQIVVAETDEEARRILIPAHEHLHANLTHLKREALKVAAGPAQAAAVAVAAPPVPNAEGGEAALAEGSAIAGSPATVLRELERQQREIGVNYMIGYFMFGTMTLADAMRSLELFTTKVKPKLEG
jgi:alkanesulfonate monooxygenase SsuD/methylene tetrahydromethanopterin reductase-like flavin-dependent oxidoreductase (luciferase family)